MCSMEEQSAADTECTSEPGDTKINTSYSVWTDEELSTTQRDTWCLIGCLHPEEFREVRVRVRSTHLTLVM